MTVTYSTAGAFGAGTTVSNDWNTSSATNDFTLAAAMQAGYDPNGYWQGPSTMAIPKCPDPKQPDGIWHPINAGDGETQFGESDSE